MTREALFLSASARPRPQDQRRAKILKAVVKILARQGIDELTLERVGKAVGMARSHVVYYFKSRDELVEAAVRFSTISAKDLILNHMASAKNWREKLDLYIEGNFRWIETRSEDATVYTLLYYLASFQPSYRKLHQEIRDVGLEVIQSILKEAPGLSKKSLGTLCSNIQGIITGNLIDAATTSQGNLRLRLESTRQAVDSLIRSSAV